MSSPIFKCGGIQEWGTQATYTHTAKLQLLQEKQEGKHTRAKGTSNANGSWHKGAA